MTTETFADKLKAADAAILELLARIDLLEEANRHLTYVMRDVLALLHMHVVTEGGVEMICHKAVLDEVRACLNEVDADYMKESDRPEVAP